MDPARNDLEALREELPWVDLREPSIRDKAKSKGWGMYLVPMGCVTTAGILAMGLYNLYKKDSVKQQKYMRYRVLAQGVTVAIAILAMLEIRK